MRIAKLFKNGKSQAVRLPKEFRFQGKEVSIHREGEAVVLLPIKPAKWPRNFFRRITMSDPAFRRPDQGEMPPPPALR
jgi:virulence-associated protein VagC